MPRVQQILELSVNPAKFNMRRERSEKRDRKSESQVSGFRVRLCPMSADARRRPIRGSGLGGGIGGGAGHAQRHTLEEKPLEKTNSF